MRRWSICSLAAAIACGAPPAVDAPVAPPGSIDALPDSELAVTRWHYHPPEMAEMVDGWPLADGSWLLVGELGERWRTEKLPAAPPQGEDRVYRAQASAHRAPERLERIVPQPGGQWLLGGSSGALYHAAAALGPLTLSAAPPGRLVALAPAKEGLVGLGPLGEVHRHDGKSWLGDARDPCGACDGCVPRCGRLFDVAAARGGAILALGHPETLLISRDGGRRWRPLDAPTFGARRLGYARDGTVVVEGAAQALAWRGGDRLEPAAGRRARIMPSEAGFEIAAARGPRAVAIDERKAALTGERYYEVVARDDEQGFALARGRLGEPLTVAPLALEGCEGTRLGAFERHVVIACLREHEGRVRATLFRSSDGGRRFARAQTIEAPDDELEIAVGAGGSALVAGACSKPGAECKARQPLAIAADPSAAVRAVAAPELVDAGALPVFSLDGRSSYFVGRRAKDERVALFVSHGGLRFVSRALAAPKDERWDPEGDGVRSLHPGLEGEVGIALDGAPSTYAVADRDGRIESVARLPEDAAQVSGAGRAILATGSIEREGEPMLLGAWESVDGGISFHEVAVVTRLEIDEFSEALSLRCAAGGCVVGSRATRVGWGEPSSAPPAPPPSVASEAPPEPAVRTPIACVVDEPMAWTTVSDVDEPVLPTASQAMRGASVWSALRQVPASGETAVVGAELSGRVSSHPLLGRTKSRAAIADHVSRQMEGYAALRAHLRGARRGTLEIAWINHMTGERGRAALEGEAPLGADDVTPGERPHLVAGLTSVSPAGMFVQPSARRDEVLVLDERGAIELRAAYPSWPATDADTSHDDAVLVGGQALAVGMHGWSPGAASVLSLAPLDGSRKPRFVTVAPGARPAGGERIAETSWSYAKGEVGIAVTTLDPEGRFGAASFSPFTQAGMGAPIEVPTLLDLPAAPTACSDEQRKSTPRINAPYAQGTRHPVIVRSPAGTQVLVSGRAILHGTPSSACVAALHAESVRESPEPLVAILPGDLSRAWLFRATPERERSLDYLPMRCAFAPAEPVPDSVWREQGTVRR